MIISIGAGILSKLFQPIKLIKMLQKMLWRKKFSR